VCVAASNVALIKQMTDTNCFRESREISGCLCIRCGTGVLTEFTGEVIQNLLTRQHLVRLHLHSLF
jgi:hypothetical protein